MSRKNIAWFLMILILALSFYSNPIYGDSVTRSKEYSITGYRYRINITSVDTELGSTITIQENSGITLVDYAVKIVLDSNNFYDWDKTDGSDVYFTDTSGNPLYYWIENWDSAGQTATIWVKMPEIPGSGTTNIIMQYGSGSNPYSSYNNPSQVFILYDDFSILDTSKWVIYGSSSSVSVNNGELVLQGTGQWNGVYYNHDVTTANNYEIIVRARASASNNGWGISTFFNDIDNRVRMGIRDYYYTTLNKIFLIEKYQGTTYWIIDYGLISIPRDTNYHLFKIEKTGDSWTIWVDEKHASNTYTLHLTSGKILALLTEPYYSGTTYIDYVIIRPYTSPEPSITVSQGGSLSIIEFSLNTTSFSDWDLLNNDGNDIFFLDQDGNPLYYQIVSIDKTGQLMTVRLDLSGKSLPCIVYMYYGANNPYQNYNTVLLTPAQASITTSKETVSDTITYSFTVHANGTAIYTGTKTLGTGYAYQIPLPEHYINATVNATAVISDGFIYFYPQTNTTLEINGYFMNALDNVGIIPEYNYFGRGTPINITFTINYVDKEAYYENGIWLDQYTIEMRDDTGDLLRKKTDWYATGNHTVSFTLPSSDKRVYFRIIDDYGLPAYIELGPYIVSDIDYTITHSDRAVIGDPINITIDAWLSINETLKPDIALVNGTSITLPGTYSIVINATRPMPVSFTLNMTFMKEGIIKQVLYNGTVWATFQGTYSWHGTLDRGTMIEWDPVLQSLVIEKHYNDSVIHIVNMIDNTINVYKDYTLVINTVAQNNDTLLSIPFLPTTATVFYDPNYQYLVITLETEETYYIPGITVPPLPGSLGSYDIEIIDDTGNHTSLIDYLPDSLKPYSNQLSLFLVLGIALLSTMTASPIISFAVIAALIGVRYWGLLSYDDRLIGILLLIAGLNVVISIRKAGGSLQ